MIDENKLIADMEKLPFIHGKHDKKNANPHFINGAESMYAIITELVDNQPKIGEWIPCSERLPEDGVNVLVTIDDGRYLSLYTFYVKSGEWVAFDGLAVDDAEITAWQPLPEPWEGESE